MRVQNSRLHSSYRFVRCRTASCHHASNKASADAGIRNEVNRFCIMLRIAANIRSSDLSEVVVTAVTIVVM